MAGHVHQILSGKEGRLGTLVDRRVLCRRVAGACSHALDDPDLGAPRHRRLESKRRLVAERFRPPARCARSAGGDRVRSENIGQHFVRQRHHSVGRRQKLLRTVDDPGDHRRRRGALCGCRALQVEEGARELHLLLQSGAHLAFVERTATAADPPARRTTAWACECATLARAGNRSGVIRRRAPRAQAGEVLAGKEGGPPGDRRVRPNVAQVGEANHLALLDRPDGAVLQQPARIPRVVRHVWQARVVHLGAEIKEGRPIRCHVTGAGVLPESDSVPRVCMRIGVPNQQELVDQPRVLLPRGCQPFRLLTPCEDALGGAVERWVVHVQNLGLHIAGRPREGVQVLGVVVFDVLGCRKDEQRLLSNDDFSHAKRPRRNDDAPHVLTANQLHARAFGLSGTARARRGGLRCVAAERANQCRATSGTTLQHPPAILTDCTR
eukprot:2505410-Prymnesium_polylepis.1